MINLSIKLNLEEEYNKSKRKSDGVIKVETNKIQEKKENVKFDPIKNE